jgi:glycosyltransferase involved in cell wall biosynthesis
MRICLVYDCLFPWTVGGAERWYRNLAERLAGDGHEITYLTRLQWGEEDTPNLPGVEVVAVSRREPLYGPDGNRRVGQAVRFGCGVLGHLVRHRLRYHVVHTASFPYFSLLAAATARRLHRFRLIVDWFELWSAAYWREYLGGPAGRVGEAVQALCLRVRQHAFCYAELTAGRVRAAGLRGDVQVLRGLYAGATSTPAPVPADPLVVFAGRLIPEKQAPAVVGAVARAREALPELRAHIFGDGPERAAVRDAIAAHGLQGVVEAPGFVDNETVEHDLARALCLVLPSRREGYGLVVVEAASVGTPVVLVRAPDNAATELVEEGVNGFVAESADARALSEAILRVHAAGGELRASTADWFARNVAELSLSGSLDAVAASYGDASARS